jgi:hypothetical protein
MVHKVIRDETVTAQSRYKFWNQNGTLTVNELQSYTDADYLETVDYVTVPHFHKRKAKGELLPLNQYSRVSQTSNYISGNYSTQHKTDPDIRALFEGKPQITGLPWILNKEAAISLYVENEELQFAVQKAAAKFYTSSFDALTFLAEFKQLIRMFSNLVPTLIGLVRRTPANQFGRKLADLDLQFRYGWRTFYYELQELKQLLDGLNKPDRKLFKATAMSGASVPIDSSPQTIIWEGATWQCMTTTSVTLSYKGLVYGTDIPPKLTFNPILTAWEVVRLSFVIDWFIAIGQWLAALQFATIHKDHTSAGGYSLSVVRETTCQAVSNANFNPTGSANFMSILDIKARVPMSVPKMPLVKLRLDSWKIIDLLALLLQALSRKRK